MGLSSPHRGKMGVPPPQRGQPPVALVLILCIGLVCTAGAYNRWLRTEGENSAGTGASGSAASKPGRGIGSSGPKPTPTLHRVAPSSPSGENSPTASSSSSLKPADPAEKKTYTMRTSSADGERTRDIRSTFASAGETKLWDKLLASTCTVDWARVVNQQLAQWLDTGVSFQQVQEHCVKRTVRLSFVQNEMRLAIFNLDNGNVHRLRCGFWLIYMAVLRAEARGDPMPDFDINMQSGDSAFSNAPPRKQWQNAGPVLGNVKCNDASVSFPLTLSDQFGWGAPNYGAMSLSRYNERYTEATAWGGGKTFGEKVPKAYFSASGGAVKRGNRAKLFKQESPHLHPDVTAHTMDYMAGFQYNVYAYGNCGWSRRIHELAMMETVVLMEFSPCREYMHGLFEEGVDHIPVEDDFSDVIPALEKGLASPKEAEAMAARWVQQGRAMLSLECTLDYVEKLLREYARLQSFKPEYHPDWPQYFPNTTAEFFKQPAAQHPHSGCAKPTYNGTWQRSAQRSHSC